MHSASSPSSRCLADVARRGAASGAALPDDRAGEEHRRVEVAASGWRGLRWSESERTQASKPTKKDHSSRHPQRRPNWWQGRTLCVWRAYFFDEVLSIEVESGRRGHSARGVAWSNIAWRQFMLWPRRQLQHERASSCCGTDQISDDVCDCNARRAGSPRLAQTEPSDPGETLDRRGGIEFDCKQPSASISITLNDDIDHSYGLSLALIGAYVARKPG